jgi:hypothetical protein
MIRKIFALMLVVGSASAWESDSTHAGLTEGAALATNLHKMLVAAYGRRLGWYETLAVPPGSAPTLYEKLARLAPSSGLVPDKSGRMSAIDWLVAGSVIEDMPAGRARDHFFDPLKKRGLEGSAGLQMRFWARVVGEAASADGVPAPDWVASAQDDLGIARFWDELEASAIAPTTAERDEHLAYALLCAGAIANVLQDMGSPSRVRDDWAEHMLPLGGGPGDRGSRFERLAAILYGRLGVPAPSSAGGGPELRAHLRDFFTSADGKGLADVTNRSWYSSGTVPRTTIVPVNPGRAEVAKAAQATQAYASPHPGAELNLTAAANGVAVLRDDRGVCLANYHLDEDRLGWFVSDDCAAEQLAVILPSVGAYTQGLFEWLFRGVVAVSADGSEVKATSPGAGTLRLFGEDAQGRRWLVDSRPAASGEEITFTLSSAAAAHAVVVFRGKDGAGEELVAVGQATVAAPTP